MLLVKIEDVRWTWFRGELVEMNYISPLCPWYLTHYKSWINEIIYSFIKFCFYIFHISQKSSTKLTIDWSTNSRNFECFRISWGGGWCLKHWSLSPTYPQVCFSNSRVRPEDLHFWQILSWSWCCWDQDKGIYFENHWTNILNHKLYLLSGVINM